MSQANKKLQGVDISETVSFKGREIDKNERYNWPEIQSNSTLMMLHKGCLQLDLPYQRQASNAIVMRIRSEWDDQLLGTLMVSFRDEVYNLLDGMHRVLAALGRADITVLPCRVFYGLTLEQEAKLFERFNTKRNSVRVIDRFKALLIARDPIAVAVERTLALRDFTVSARPMHHRHIKAVTQLCSIMETQGSEALFWVVRMAADIASVRTDVVNEELLRGLRWVHRKVVCNMDPFAVPELEERLQKLCLTEFYKDLRGRKISLGLTAGGSIDPLAGQVLLDMVNRGRRRNKFVAVKKEAS